MPRLSVWFIRASMLYLLLGLFCGALILIEKGLFIYAAIWNLFPLHVEFLLIGWLFQLAMGVAFWIVPRFGKGFSRGSEGVVWASFVLLNAGILIGALQFWFPVALLIGRISEVCGGILFVIGSWRRIKPQTKGK
ncbi:MAG: hypothetical protein IT311_02025 [Anaerolineales bacterium]|nr:hypothetical protein [Anaerolineales bacterium]MCZ2121446.1 cbb3-type cytochrome c oxidase subunit I [Anaerolineales bacterium]